MADGVTRLRRFLRELRRRKVYRVAGAYVAVAFVVLQVADLVSDPLGLPGWAMPTLIVFVALGFPVSLVLAWALESTPEGVRRTPAIGDAPSDGEGEAGPEPSPSGAASPATESQGRPRPAVSREPGKSVAVLPFTDMSPGGDQAYFGDGLAEEVLNALTQLGDLRVAARTSSFAYRGTDANVREIGEDLRVATVLEGSVRKAGDRLRVTAQLVDTEDGYHLWSKIFDRELEDVFAIQDEITASIVEALQVELLGDEAGRLSRVGTDDPAAYDLYLRGRHYWHRRYKVGLDTAVEYFEAALEEDPDFALPHAGVAEVCWVLGIYGMARPAEARERGLRASERALELGPDLPECRCARALMVGEFLYEHAAAVSGFERALELDPSHARAEVWRSLYLHWDPEGREEAAEAARRAVEMEPDSSYVRAAAGLSHLASGLYGEAAALLDGVLREEPEDVLALYVRALVHGRQEEHEAAVELLERATALTNRAAFIVALLGAGLGRGGQRARAEEILEELEERREGAYVAPLFLATVEAHVGRTDDALDHFEEHYRAHNPGLGAFVNCGVLDPLRGEPRFDAVVEELELA